MKDKLFWIALIFAGIYLFNKMNSGNANSATVETERLQDRQERTGRAIDEPHFGDQDAPLQLPRKNGETQSSSTAPSRQADDSNQRNLPELSSQNQEKEVSLGEYGSITLPKKSGTKTTNQPNTTNQRTTTENRNSSIQTIELNPNTKRGEGIMTNVSNQPLLVLDGKVLQVSSLENSEIYMDANSFCTISSGSNNIVYVMSGAQLMLTGNGSNNTIYYEQGSSVRNGIKGTNNELVELQGLSFK